MKLTRTLAATALLSGTLMAAGTTPASAATSTGYLTRLVPAMGPFIHACTKKTVVSLAATNLTASPSSWDALAASSDVTAGNFETYTYLYNGVKKYDEFVGCVGGQHVYQEIPTVYVHRYEYVNFYEDGAGVAYLDTVWTAWQSGVKLSL